jgi:hypothetical protein
MKINGIELLPADLVLVKGDSNNFIDREIDAITNSKYCHVAGVSLDGRLLETQGEAETRFQKIEAYKGSADVYRMESLTDEQREKVVKSVMEQLGNGYDYLAIAWEVARYKLHIQLPFVELHHTSICSSLWAIDGFRKNGIQVCDWTKCPSPGDFALDKQFKYIGSY